MKNQFPPVYYSDYLKLDSLLSSQTPKSLEYSGKLAHDEVLFIIVHQAYELWFKQILHELNSVADTFQQDYVNEKEIGTCVHRLRRVIEIQKLLIDQLRVLETMTPLDFLDFRDYLMPASGFQSFQFRMIENTLGLQPGQRKEFDKSSYMSRLSEEHQELVRKTETRPSLLRLTEAWLERTPFLDFSGFNFWQAYQEAVDAMLAADRKVIENNETLSDTQKANELSELDKTARNFEALFDAEKHEQLQKKGSRTISHRAMQAALLISLYRDEPILHLPFALITALIEIDELMTAWRYRHALMVHRMIGVKIGTGGSSGHNYLRVTAESHKVFSDFTNLSTYLIPRTKLPELPKALHENLGFHFEKMKG